MFLQPLLFYTYTYSHTHTHTHHTHLVILTECFDRAKEFTSFIAKLHLQKIPPTTLNNKKNLPTFPTEKYFSAKIYKILSAEKSQNIILQVISRCV